MATTVETATTPLLSQHRPARRRLSTSYTNKQHGRALCQPLSPSVEALDLSFSSPLPVLATLRLHVLSYLADLETRLALLESPISADTLKTRGESTVDEARAWAATALEMLSRIRADVCSHLPELHIETPSVEEFVKSHIPDVPRLDEVRAHLPAMPDAVRSRLPDMSDMRSRLEDVRFSFHEIDFHSPLDYIPTLSDNLQSLQSHLASVDLPQSLRDSVAYLKPHSTLSELIDRVMTSDFVSGVSADIRGGEDMLERAAIEISRAVRQSLNGSRLIHYVDLPEKWRNNRFVTRGYRFIPLQQWPLIIMSVFALHNETVNIHTHFIPFLVWSFNLIPLNPFAADANLQSELPEFAFTAFALLCLFTSALWHTMAGCAHPEGMELCARVDYVGIGWLISASVGTVVYYGFQGHEAARNNFLAVCLVMGFLGSVFPFMNWFNDIKYRNYRIVFFLALALSSIAPLAHLSYLYSACQMFAFIRPLLPSLLMYIAGLVFYATHFPECVLARPGETHWLDWLGGGSHAIWHLCIVFAISLHRHAMDSMKAGIGAA
ncbi:HlyIII-domain-containing protein [Phanerochaete sordida]|uniref:HlyIII-domain-containing protein n=1 Tax=Phanerochaete sordida TaxID=48140 RepID=A0A9P3GMN2_9APHY|nr:HlyIII-domain-containing protein [Phanerochaete sordida]